MAPSGVRRFVGGLSGLVLVTALLAVGWGGAASARPVAATGTASVDLALLARLRVLPSGFGAGAPVSRGEFALMLQRLFGLIPVPACGAVFADVPAGAADAAAIGAVDRAGWMRGIGDDRFQPDGPVTVAKAVTAVARALGLATGGPLLFADAASIPAWAAFDVRSAVEAGLVPESTAAFRPQAPLTGAAAARLLVAAFSSVHAPDPNFPAPPPAPPLPALVPSGDRMALAWPSVAGAGAYVVERRVQAPDGCWSALPEPPSRPPVYASGGAGRDQQDLRIVDLSQGGAGWGIEVPAKPPYGDGHGLDYPVWRGDEIRVAFPPGGPRPAPGDRLSVLYAPHGIRLCGTTSFGWCWPADTYRGEVRWSAGASAPGIAVDPAAGTLTLSLRLLPPGAGAYRVLARGTDGLLSPPSEVAVQPAPTAVEIAWAKLGLSPAAVAAVEAAAASGPGTVLSLGGLDPADLPPMPARSRHLAGRQLFFADSPEQAQGPGLLYSAPVSGSVRAYYDVTNDTGGAADVNLVLRDAGPTTVAYAVYREDESANIGVTREGIDVSAAILRAPSKILIGRLNPGEQVVLDPLSPTIQRWYSLLGFCDLWVGGPAQLSFVLAPAPWDAAAYMGSGILPLIPPATRPWDGAGRGTFPRSRREIDLRPPAGGPAVVDLANGRQDPWVRGKDATTRGPGGDEGNYGVTYVVRGQPAVTTALVAVPLGSPYWGVMEIGGHVYTAPHDPLPAAYPGAFLVAVWPAGRRSSFAWTPPGGSEPPLALVSVPIGDLTAPAVRTETG